MGVCEPREGFDRIIWAGMRARADGRAVSLRQLLSHGCVTFRTPAVYMGAMCLASRRVFVCPAEAGRWLWGLLEAAWLWARSKGRRERYHHYQQYPYEKKRPWLMTGGTKEELDDYCIGCRENINRVGQSEVSIILAVSFLI